MKLLKKLFIIKLIFASNFFVCSSTLAEDNDINEILKLLQQDIKTLEKAVYSGSIELDNGTSNSSTLDSNSEDVLTRHLLKLSEIENQFQQLTNRFEEINFKLDKLSTRLSKIQADNQIRFQDIESSIASRSVIDSDNKLSSKPKVDNKVLPGSSQPQDLGTISYCS